jgi:hypothetical protein
MADITRIAAPSLATSVPCHCALVDQGGNKVAEVDIAAGQICYIKASNAKVNLATGAAANEAARAWGIAARACKAGEPVTLYKDVEFEYGSGMTLGTPLFVSATAGALADAASTGGTTRVAHVVSATRIRFKGDL